MNVSTVEEALVGEACAAGPFRSVLVATTSCQMSLFSGSGKVILRCGFLVVCLKYMSKEYNRECITVM